MIAVFRTTCLAACLLLAGCGNKGDLYLEEVELTEEQKVLLNDLEAEKAKKKKTTTPQTAQ